MKTIISWDCGYKTLSYCIITYNENIFRDIEGLMARCTAQLATSVTEQDIPALMDLVRQMQGLLQTALYVVGIEVIDVLEGRPVAEFSEEEKIRKLKTAIRALMTRIDPVQIHCALIEHQPAMLGNKAAFGRAATTTTNSDSAAVSHVLAAHFDNFVFVDPKLKNTIALGPQLDFEHFKAAKLQTVKNKKEAVRSARKQHTKENLLHYAREALWCPQRRPLDLSKVPAKAADDAGDAFMQGVAWIVTQEWKQRA